MDEIKTYKDFNLTKKQGLYCEYRVQNYNKRKSYMMAFNVTDEQQASETCWHMEQRVGKKLDAYMDYLESLSQDRLILSLKQLQEEYIRIALDENVNARERLKAMELYGKTIGAFTDNVNVKAEVEQVVFVEEFPDEEGDKGE